MSEYKVYLNWQQESEDFSYNKYSRTHQWNFGGGIQVTASAAPEYLGNAAYVNPEEAFLASLSSCHLLTFLSITSFRKFKVKSYEDYAVALLEKNSNKKMAVTKVYLRPKVVFTGEHLPDNIQLQQMHHKAHEECFISNSVLTEIILEPVL